MANTKIDSIKLAGSTETYDIDLPSTATPNITGLTTSSLSVTGSSNLTDVTTTGNVSISSPNEAGSTIKIYNPVAGKIQLEQGCIDILGNNNTYISLTDDPMVRISGNVGVDITSDNHINLAAPTVTAPNIQINWDNGVYGSFTTKLAGNSLAVTSVSTGIGLYMTFPTVTGVSSYCHLPYVTDQEQVDLTRYFKGCAKKSSSNIFTGSNTFTGSVTFSGALNANSITVNNRLSVNDEIQVNNSPIKVWENNFIRVTEIEKNPGRSDTDYTEVTSQAVTMDMNVGGSSVIILYGTDTLTTQTYKYGGWVDKTTKLLIPTDPTGGSAWLGISDTMSTKNGSRYPCVTKLPIYKFAILRKHKLFYYPSNTSSAMSAKYITAQNISSSTSAGKGYFASGIHFISLG